MNSVSTDHFLEIQGQRIPFTPGETIYEALTRAGINVPTLCYDPRLEPFGACRLCVVSVEGQRGPVASCTTRASDGMKIQSHNQELNDYRRILLEMVASENRTVDVNPLSGLASQELKTLVDAYGARTGRFLGKKSGHSRPDDPNPFILRDYDQCISCYRCVRVCAEQEGDYAISIMNRGFESQITTEFEGTLKDSACTFCGQCVQTCPTGALGDKKALRAAEDPRPIEKTRSICPYCGVGCSVDILTKGDRLVGVHPAMDGPANKGALCVKGQFAFDFVQHPERLSHPLVRNEAGVLVEATWEEALTRTANAFKSIAEEHGNESLFAIASGRAPHESAYMLQKFMRAGWGIHHIDNCSRA